MSVLPPGYVLRGDGTAYRPTPDGGTVRTAPSTRELLARGLAQHEPQPAARDLPVAVEFEVPGRCQAWQRVGRGANGGAYVPDQTREFKARVRGSAGIAMRGLEPFAGPVRLSLTFYLARGGNTSPGLTLPVHQSCGDLSNFLKAVEDACNRVVWIDDRQVAELRAGKLFCAPEAERVSVRVEGL